MPDSKKTGSSLHVQKGVSQPASLNPETKATTKKQAYTTEQLSEGVLSGNRTRLSLAITLIESTLPEHQEQAQQIIETCIEHSGKSIRIGITGIPGVGKSTFIEALGLYLTSQGRKVAVLAIDPSSQKSKGSILGDKTRMEKLANQPNAFIRPSPAAGSLGGVARKTRETIMLCEAAGFDTVFVETVGVGQSETSVHSMVDFFLLLMLSGAGDELQGIKRGIIEMMDMMVINKADENLEKATRAQSIYQSALHLFPQSESGFGSLVQLCSALKNTGIKEIWETIMAYQNTTIKNGYFHDKRKDQARHWLYESIQQTVLQDFFSNKQVNASLPQFEQKVLNEQTSPFKSAAALIKIYHATK